MSDLQYSEVCFRENRQELYNYLVYTLSLCTKVFSAEMTFLHEGMW